MRIERLELRNFRNYERMDLDFTQPRTLLIGENGVGKSTLIDAILWGLIGRCRGVDGKGSGQKDLIRTGAEDMQVTVVTDTLGPITRSVSRAGSATGSMKADMVLGRLDTTEGMLTACIYGQHFFGLDHGAAKAMLLKLLDVQIDPAALPGLNLSRPAGLEELEVHYQAAFQKRADLKKQLAGIHVPDPPKVVQIDTAGKTVDQLRAELKILQGQLTTAIRAQADADRNVTATDQALQKADVAARQIEQLKGAVTAHEGMLAEQQRKLAEAQTALADAERQPAEPVSSLQVQVSETRVLVDKISRHSADLADTGVERPKGKKKQLDVIQTPHSCVLSSSIPCLTPASEFGAALDGLKATVQSLEDRISRGNQRVAAIAAADGQVREATRNLTYHETQVTQAQAKVAAAEAAIRELDVLKVALPDQQAAARAEARNVLTIQGLVQKVMDQITTLAQQERDRAAHQTAVQRLHDAQQAVNDAEALVTLLGPKGIRLKALEAALVDFQDAINVALDPFGFQLAINVDPWRVDVKTPDTDGRAIPFELLSQGQKLWTGLAFQAALAALSNLDVFAVDDAEKVVGRSLEMVTEQVMTLPVGQIIVAMAKAEDAPVPDLDGLQVVRLAAAPVGV